MIINIKAKVAYKQRLISHENRLYNLYKIEN